MKSPIWPAVEGFHSSLESLRFKDLFCFVAGVAKKKKILISPVISLSGSVLYLCKLKKDQYKALFASNGQNKNIFCQFEFCKHLAD